MFHVTDYQDLNPTQIERLRALFANIAAYQLSAASVLDGIVPGEVWMDDAESPTAALMDSPEGMYLAGNPNNKAFNRALNEYIRAHLYDTVDEIDNIWLVYDPPGWGDKLIGLLYPRQPLIFPRRHYVCRALAVDWRALLPDGFSVQRIDADLLARDDLAIPDHVRGWVTGNWRSIEGFMAHGFGFCTIHDTDHKLVSWSIADCAHGAGCEIGIQTVPAYRRRGFATITAAAAVDHALSNGYTWVGWHCHDDNLGSIGTAQKVGFELERHYINIYAMLNLWDHLSEQAWLAFRAGNYPATVELYEQTFALRADVPDYYYLMAARANAATDQPERALHYIAEALERGSVSAAYLADKPEFESLRERAEWHALMEKATADS